MIRRLTTHLSLALVFVVWAALLVGSGSDGAEVRASIQASNCGVWWDWTEDEWNYTVAYSEIRDYAARPPERALEAINVEWLPPELDALGNLCVIRGRLKIADDTQKRTRPVDWFQGITVYMGKTPGAKPDWSRGMDQKTALSETAVVCPSGEFEVRLDRRKSQHDRSRHQPLQFGLALARHLETGKGGQQVVWNSRAPAISATVKMLDVPAAAKLSRELELINSASGWPSSDPNGAALIRAVNALQQLGKERALATLEEYVDLTDSSDYHSESEIVFWIIRVLFEPIRLNDRIPCPMIAVFLVEEKSAAAPDWPLNPMAIVDDVPFMVGHQCGGSGIPRTPLVPYRVGTTPRRRARRAPQADESSCGGPSPARQSAVPAVGRGVADPGHAIGQVTSQSDGRYDLAGRLSGRPRRRRSRSPMARPRSAGRPTGNPLERGAPGVCRPRRTQEGVTQYEDPLMSGTSAPTPRERRWLQYSLRTLLVLILTAVFFLAICAVGLYGSVRCACDRS